MTDIKVTVGGAIEEEASRRFIDAWHRAEQGESFQERHLAFENWEALSRVLTGKRMELLRVRPQESYQQRPRPGQSPRPRLQQRSFRCPGVDRRRPSRNHGSGHTGRLRRYRNENIDLIRTQSPER